MARRLVVPDWARTHPSVSFSRSETKNIRSASDRWAIEKIAARGLPAAVWRSAPTSSGSPSSQASKPGAARRLLSRVASSKRSFGGKKASRSSAPTLATGGVWICWMSPGRSRSRPSRHAASKSRASRMCSRLWSGSASIPRRPSRLVAVVAIRSRKSSASSRTAAAGAANDLTIDTGSPAVLPGV